jgi:S1-C subfamily serine protease
MSFIPSSWRVPLQRCAPSVVNITSLQNARLNLYSPDVTQVPAGTGSGFVWDAEGHNVTNFHVSAITGCLWIPLLFHHVLRHSVEWCAA